ncbi:(d)CMP kinase [Bacillus lacus]|uniref:Cytidylate kinase n=1 Tax=Metabacillus lacus TaxID=1983721 RepID=A0A7X2IWP3_9BACI|nr:(d)CMP kinase [Metabacillus lacus]MRX71020.1 (d)CMP kinase [Metabacillus lacus]
MTRKISIAIDGPAAAGKSTVAKIIAEDMTYIYIDTGAMYRAITFEALNKGISLEDEEALNMLLKDTQIALIPKNGRQLVEINGMDVTDIIRSNEVTNSVSIPARLPKIREEMVKRQREMASSGGVVMDGRDIGTHVLPHAEVKVFLRASVEERARRRFEENLGKGIDTDLELLKHEIALRDKIDSEREAAPLKKAEDAVEIDTTSLDIQGVVGRIKELINERL